MNGATGTRRGLVLGAGGLLGVAWMLGALQALAEADGVDARESDVLVGTSAGAVTAALLAAGVGVDAMVRHQRGTVRPGDPRIDYDYATATGGALPPLPRPWPGSLPLLRTMVRHPRRLSPTLALAALLPAGRRSTTPVGRAVDMVVPPGEWAEHPASWIVAMDYASGQRVAFGRTGAPPAGLADAVMASCAVPGWYAPICIDGRRYVDGGMCSSTSVDLLAGLGLDEVVVLAPMASFSHDAPTSLGVRLERRWRRLVTRRLVREATLVRDGGTAVTLLAPGAEDLAVMGANLMNPGRREQVLETSLRTSAHTLARARAGSGVACHPVGCAPSRASPT